MEEELAAKQSSSSTNLHDANGDHVCIFTVHLLCWSTPLSTVHDIPRFPPIWDCENHHSCSIVIHARLWLIQVTVRNAYEFFRPSIATDQSTSQSSTTSSWLPDQPCSILRTVMMNQRFQLSRRGPRYSKWTRLSKSPPSVLTPLADSGVHRRECSWRSTLQAFRLVNESKHCTLCMTKALAECQPKADGWEGKHTLVFGVCAHFSPGFSIIEIWCSGECQIYWALRLASVVLQQSSRKSATSVVLWNFSCEIVRSKYARAYWSWLRDGNQEGYYRLLNQVKKVTQGGLFHRCVTKMWVLYFYPPSIWFFISAGRTNNFAIQHWRDGHSILLCQWQRFSSTLPRWLCRRVRACHCTGNDLRLYLPFDKVSSANMSQIFNCLEEWSLDHRRKSASRVNFTALPTTPSWISSRR